MGILLLIVVLTASGGVIVGDNALEAGISLTVAFLAGGLLLWGLATDGAPFFLSTILLS